MQMDKQMEKTSTQLHPVFQNMFKTMFPIAYGGMMNYSSKYENQMPESIPTKITFKEMIESKSKEELIVIVDELLTSYKKVVDKQEYEELIGWVEEYELLKSLGEGDRFNNNKNKRGVYEL